MTNIGWDDQPGYYTAWDRIRDERREEARIAEIERSKACPNYQDGTRRCNCKLCRAHRKDIA